MNNVIVFGVGKQGTRLIVSMLNNCGFNVGDVTPKMEYKWAQNINKQICISNNICPCGVNIQDYPICSKCKADVTQFQKMSMDTVKCINNLKSPWVIKDPRFVLTLYESVWTKVWEQTQPFLLYITRNYDDLVTKYIKGWNNTYDIYGYDLQQMVRFAQDGYEQWKYSKLHITFEQVVNMAKLVNFNRAERL